MSKILPKLKRASPTILTFLGAAGFVGTVILAVNATPKAMNHCYEVWDRSGDKDPTMLDYVKVGWKDYIPAASVGAATLVCMFASNGLNRKQQASITSAYVFLDQAYRQYRTKVQELYGDRADAEVRNEIAKDAYADDIPPKNPDEIPLFFDFFSGRYFNRTIQEVMDAEYGINRKFAHEDYVTVNDFYDLLGLDPIEFGDSIGWSIGAGENFYNYKWIDFEHELQVMDDGMECYILHMPYPPSADFMDYC